MQLGKHGRNRTNVWNYAGATAIGKPAEVEAAITLPVVEPMNAPSKQAQLIAKLRSPGGATLASLVQLTGWQPHTVRGTISGVLRKRLNLQVVCSAEGDAGRVYRIVEAA